MDLIVTSIIIVALALVAARISRGFERTEQPLFWLSFVMHQASGMAMVFITRDYYEGGDMLGYHEVGIRLAARLQEDFWATLNVIVAVIFHQPAELAVPIQLSTSNTGAMQGVAGVLMFLLLDSLFAACALIAGGSFFAKIAIYKVLKAELPEVPRLGLLAACTVVPSAVFWTSGLLKEPIAFLGLGSMVWGTHAALSQGRRWLGGFALITGAAAVLLLKGYILPPFGFGAAFLLLVRGLRRRSKDAAPKVGMAILSVVVGVAVVVGTGTLFPQFAVENFAEQAMQEQEIGARTAGGSNYSLGESAPSFGGQLALAPLALATALFRPVIFEANNVMMAFSALEMLVLTVFFVRVLAARSIVDNAAEVLRRPALSFCVAFVVTMGVGVGLASTNIGSLSRYRAPMMPFFSAALVTLGSLRRTKRVESQVAIDPRFGARVLGKAK